jgi:hypothetical protein
MLRSDRQIEVNQAEWDDCLRCPEFDHCYKLCLAKLNLEAAIANARLPRNGLAVVGRPMSAP